MENYLKGEEYIGGAYSWETRYPFCDTKLIQEFLWLKPELKNEYQGTNYKPPILSYLDKNNFPFHNYDLIHQFQKKKERYNKLIYFCLILILSVSFLGYIFNYRFIEFL